MYRKSGIQKGVCTMSILRKKCQKVFLVIGAHETEVYNYSP